MLNLSPMRFKNYVWPHNPRVYEIRFQKKITEHHVPFGRTMLRSMGLGCRIMRGEGEFTGPGAYEEFKKLASVFYDDSPGVLTHPLWQPATVYFSALELRQEPTEDYVAYSFEFRECFDAYDAGVRALYTPAAAVSAAPALVTAAAADAEKWYTAVYGDCLWNIARSNGMSLNELLALNPQIKNPNLLYVGDRVRIA